MSSESSAPVQVPAMLAGLMCRYGECRALFSDLDEASTHANDKHGGKLVVDTCSIREFRNAIGEIELVLAPENESIVHSPKEPPTIPDERSTLPIVQLAGHSAPVSSTLVPNIDQSVATIEPVSMTAHGPTAIMERILRLAGELEGQCRVCWAEGKAGRMHFSYRCDSGICSGNGWKLFKAKTAFPSGLVCFLCFTTYGPPFNHEVPPPGVRYKGQLCDYSDGLKELAYIIYHSEAKRNAVFARLGHTVPATLVSYWRFIGRKQASGLLGLYEVLSAYLDTKEGGGLGDGLQVAA